MSVQAMKSGAVEFLMKPFRTQELHDAIQQALDRERKLREGRRRSRSCRQRYDTLTPRNVK
jgi:FixJ family two-component response regulator